MEIVDNGMMLIIPGPWTPDSAASGSGETCLPLLVAGAAAYPVNRWLLSRGKGHAVVHLYHQGHRAGGEHRGHEH